MRVSGLAPALARPDFARSPSGRGRRLDRSYQKLTEINSAVTVCESMLTLII